MSTSTAVSLLLCVPWLKTPRKFYVFLKKNMQERLAINQAELKHSDSYIFTLDNGENLLIH